jgi:hypothetical protein
MSTNPLNDARHAFLERLIDDAGLFPPARLPMPEAVARHAHERRAAHGWLIRRFACTASRLDDLAAALPPDAAGWRVAVIADGAGASWAEGLRVDLKGVAGFAKRADGQATVETLEARLPEGASDLAAAVEAGVAELAGSVPRDVATFLEVRLGADWRQVLPAALDAIAAAREDLHLGAKIRCGGMVPDAFPSAEQVAAFLAGTLERGLLVKATAGLHHPLRSPDPVTAVTMHGFFNVAGGAILLHGGAVDAARLADLVADGDPDAFALDADGFRWRDATAGPDAIARAREEFFTTFGSCILDEPVADLRQLGALEPDAS